MVFVRATLGNALQGLEAYFSPFQLKILISFNGGKDFALLMLLRKVVGSIVDTQ